MTRLEAGSRLRSAMSSTEVLVTKGGPGQLTCGGLPMVPATGSGDDRPRAAGAPEGHETALGKRYTTADGSVQVLCVRAGAGRLAVDGSLLRAVGPKLLPASD